MVAIKSASVWRWPPDNAPTFVCSLSSSPRFTLASNSLYASTRAWLVPLPSPYIFPLLSAIARFSRIVMDGQVPFDGSWNTRPMRRWRIKSFCFVISTPLTTIFPPSTGMVPQIMLSIDVLPEPLLPTTETNCPSSIFKLKSSNRQISLIVPGLYILWICFNSNI